MTPDEWDELVDQLQRGLCTPVLGPDVVPGLWNRNEKARREWAGEYGFPFGADADVAEILQHAAVAERDRTAVTQRLATELTLSRSADLDDPRAAHAVLATLPISVYLTTDRDDLVSPALTRQGRTPVVAQSAWYRGARTNPALRLPGDYRPSVERPLVVQLYGSVANVASLVATEQDHLALAAALVADDARGEHEVLPIQVLPALTQRRLLFLGHRFHDWTFRLLAQTLLDLAWPEGRESVLVHPPPESSEILGYAERHRIRVHWDEPYGFVDALRQAINLSPPRPPP